MDHIEGTFQGFGDVHLFYQRWRPEKKPKAVLVIVHGFGEHSGRYMNVVDHFVPRQYAIYGLDHRGHGRSPGQRGHVNSFEEFRGDVDAFVKLVDQQEPRIPIFLWGHSMGGLIGLDYILHHPEGLRGAIISGPSLTPSGFASPIMVTLTRIFSRLWPTFSIDIGLDAMALARTPEVGKAYREDTLVHGRASTRLGTELELASNWVKAHVAELKIPLLMIHGDADTICPVSETLSFFEQVTFADKELKVYPGGYHESHNDIEHEQVMADVEGWIKQHM
ncbi:MAG: lysophospholipase [Anaerolineae bacterium]|nr:lysophospholipase [Anaerolineae bacterium]